MQIGVSDKNSSTLFASIKPDEYKESLWSYKYEVFFL